MSPAAVKTKTPRVSHVAKPAKVHKASGVPLAVVRVRGTIRTKPNIRTTLKQMRLHKTNHCVIVPKDVTFRGMLQLVKDYVTYGEIDAKTFAALLTSRGFLLGDKPLTDEMVQGATGLASIAEFAEAAVRGDAKLSDLPVKPVFRLNPPKKGYGGNKRHFTVGGALGYRGVAINDLVGRMI
ncbi:MAG: 50S ribosomal protein L30 [Methanobacteriota archaeon]